MASLMDQLKRLERAGAEHSRANEKLRSAAHDVAQHIAEHLDSVAAVACQRRHNYVLSAQQVEVALPRGYAVDDTSRGPILVTYNGDSEYGEVLNRHPASAVLPTQAAALQFARDLADGWLAEAAAAVETLAAEAAAAAAQIETAAPAVAMP